MEIVILSVCVIALCIAWYLNVLKNKPKMPPENNNEVLEEMPLNSYRGITIDPAGNVGIGSVNSSNNNELPTSENIVVKNVPAKKVTPKKPRKTNTQT